MTGPAVPAIEFDELRERYRPVGPFHATPDGLAPGKRVLGDGWIILADWMGDDRSIVEAARISTGQGTKSAKEDRGLIRYLMRNRHTTPFEMVEFKFIVKCPMFVWRQWIRHRTASVNEMSGRYVQLPEEFFVPGATAIRKQSKSMKQGRSEEAVQGQAATDFVVGLQSDGTRAFQVYQQALRDGIGSEIARVGLPLSTYTVAYWKIDLHNLLGFLGLRLDLHAQEEIRVYAQAIAEIIQPIVPVAYEAFEDFRLRAITFSGPEIEAISKLHEYSRPETSVDVGRILDDLNRESPGTVSPEFRTKLQRLRLIPGGET